MNLLHPARVPAIDLLELLELRATLRAQVARLDAGLNEVQSEIRSWRRHRMAQALVGSPVPSDLAAGWEELVAQESELRNDLEVATGALQAVSAEVDRALATDSLAG